MFGIEDARFPLPEVPTEPPPIFVVASTIFGGASLSGAIFAEIVNIKNEIKI